MMGTGEAEGENRAMAATELALNNPLIDEYTLQGAKGLLINITGGSDLTLFEVDAAVNKIRAEVDPEAELIFGAIKDQNMSGKIRVSIVATSLKGSSIIQDPRPKFNVVNGSNTRSNNFSDNLFSKTNLEQNVVNSIDGATALKLDENFEIKNLEEQNAVMDNFENYEENKIVEEKANHTQGTDEVPAGVSIESASYIEKNIDSQLEQTVINNALDKEGDIEEDHAPKLFSEENHSEIKESTNFDDMNESEELIDHEKSDDEDFEIPAFLRRQKVLMIKFDINENPNIITGISPFSSYVE